jgi:hypothetical protein
VHHLQAPTRSRNAAQWLRARINITSTSRQHQRQHHDEQNTEPSEESRQQSRQEGGRRRPTFEPSSAVPARGSGATGTGAAPAPSL